MDKMNTENFKILVDALEALPEDIKNNEVAMNSALKPNPFCGTAGCFAGLISIVANDIPELKELYAGEKYCFTEWAEALKKFLGISIEVWAWENPTVWGNYRGANAYVYNEAWGKGAEETLIHNDIIIHLMNAYDNWIKFLESKGENDEYWKVRRRQ
jgi:hypothetical protein